MSPFTDWSRFFFPGDTLFWYKYIHHMVSMYLHKLFFITSQWTPSNFGNLNILHRQTRQILYNLNVVLMLFVLVNFFWSCQGFSSLPGLYQYYLAEDKVSCSWTQHSASEWPIQSKTYTLPTEPLRSSFYTTYIKEYCNCKYMSKKIRKKCKLKMKYFVVPWLHHSSEMLHILKPLKWLQSFHAGIQFVNENLFLISWKYKKVPSVLYHEYSC